MDQFTVPQFLEVEPQVIGPITVRQFLIMMGGALLLFAVYQFSDLTLFAILGSFIILLVVCFAFVKVNGQNFHYFILNILQTARRPRLRVWNKSKNTAELKAFMKSGVAEVVVAPPAKRATPSRSHLSEIALIVDTGGQYGGE